MYNIIFYEDKNGNSEILNLLDDLQRKAKKSKDARINREKILSYMAALERYGTRVGEPIVKYIDKDIWEMRSLKNRIFFFYWKDDTFVLLHHYIKKSQEMPKREFKKAQNNLKDFLERSDE